MTKMYNPPHPGETLREDILPALGVTVTETAKQLGVTRAALSRVLNEKAAISPAMALRLEGWRGVDNGGRADLWVGQQTAYRLWQTRKAGMPKPCRESMVKIKALKWPSEFNCSLMTHKYMPQSGSAVIFKR